MRHLASIALVLTLLVAVLGVSAPSFRPAVVLISIDGLRPDYVLEADHYGLRIPELRRILREGAHANAVTGVLPTVTYPSHTTLVTGVSPARHGIFANHPFDPTGKNLDGWFWYAEDIHARTLWDAAAEAGLTTSSVDWPVTVGAHITYNIAQYWRASTPDDAKLSRALATPGLLAEAERELGPYPAGDSYSVAEDRRRAAFNAWLIRRKRARLHLCYFSGLDDVQHRSGPASAEAFAALEAIDGLVGQVRAAADQVSGGRGLIAIVSDHGFARAQEGLRVNDALRDAGLLRFDRKGEVAEWRAAAWSAGGSVAIVIRDPSDAEAKRRVKALVERLAADPRSGIERILDQRQAGADGGFSNAAFVLGLKGGPRVGPAEGHDAPHSTGGVHGLLPDNPDMDATFLVEGPGVPKGRDLGRIDMRDVAPTLARFMGVRLPEAEGRAILD